MSSAEPQKPSQQPQIKLLMSWDIQAKREGEYSEFIVNEFIPRLNRVGLKNLEFWYTSFGEQPQIQASGLTDSIIEMRNILESEEWESLQGMLGQYVQNYKQKLVKAAQGFQI